MNLFNLITLLIVIAALFSYLNTRWLKTARCYWDNGAFTEFFGDPNQPECHSSNLVFPSPSDGGAN